MALCLLTAAACGDRSRPSPDPAKQAEGIPTDEPREWRIGEDRLVAGIMDISGRWEVANRILDVLEELKIPYQPGLNVGGWMVCVRDEDAIRAKAALRSISELAPYVAQRAPRLPQGGGK